MKNNGKHSMNTLMLFVRSHYTGQKGTTTTRRQLKHDILLTFMEQSRKQKTGTAPVPRSLLKAILSIFF